MERASLRRAMSRAQTIGIDRVVFDDTPREGMAEIVISGFEAASRRGVGMPEGLAFRRVGADTLRIAAFLPRSDTIVINLDNPFWDDPETTMRALVASRIFPIAAPAFPVLHELGHRSHYLALGDPVRWTSLRLVELNRSERRIIQREVGANATLDPLELVADVYALLVSGRIVSGDVMDLYRRFGGPTL